MPPISAIFGYSQRRYQPYRSGRSTIFLETRKSTGCDFKILNSLSFEDELNEVLVQRDNGESQASVESSKPAVGGPSTATIGALILCCPLFDIAVGGLRQVTVSGGRSGAKRQTSLCR
jgi:hypothetical protein